jgi:Immunoglobulin-like domain of bacterial spore germination/Sporulation and spore germination
MKRGAILVAATALIAAGCGREGPVTVGTLPPTEPTPTTSGPSVDPSVDPSETPTGETVTLDVWFHLGEKLFQTRRTLPATRAVGATSMEQLLAGPTPEETEAGVGTSVPPGTEFRALSIEGGVATVDLSSEYESGGGSFSMFMRLAQVVYTLTQFESVDGVLFELDGEPVQVFSSEGIVLDGPVDRQDYMDLFPIILVEQPLIGDRVTSPVTISGVANVFEANVLVEVLDQDGRQVGFDFTTATCGTGCYGDYMIDLAFDVGTEQLGTIVVSESDPSDGEGPPPDRVEIPVTLAP